MTGRSGFLLRSIGGAAASLFVASALICFVIRVIPGDPVRDNLKNPTPELVAQQRARLGLDKPWWKQYFVFGVGVLRGDFGSSFINDEPVSSELMRRWPATVELALAAMVLATALGGMQSGLR
jgi:peptide/nickel transport system permease protein